LFKLKNKLIIFLLIVGTTFSSLVFPQEGKQPSKAKESLITLDFKNADIRDVLRSLARISGKNIIISPKIKNKISMSLKDVTWKQALEMIAATYGLSLDYRENYIRVATVEELRREEEALPSEVKIIPLKFADASTLKDVVKPFLGPRGRIEVNSPTNAIVINDTSSRIRKIEKIIKELDTRTPQIFIEAMLLDLKLTHEAKLGVNWSVLKEATVERRGDTQYLDTGAEVVLPTSSAMLAIKYGKSILDRTTLQALITMFQEKGEAEILANPRVLTLDNKEAEINLIEEIPYSVIESTAGGTVTGTQFKEAGVKLKVKPHITGDLITSKIEIEESFLSGYTPDSQPKIENRNAQLNLAVKSGETIVIGGLRKRSKSKTIDKVPFLGNIPFLRIFFRKKVESNVNSELLLFLTPYIITQPQMSLEEKEKLKKFRGMRYLRVKEELSNKKLLPLKPPPQR